MKKKIFMVILSLIVILIVGYSITGFFLKSYDSMNDSQVDDQTGGQIRDIREVTVTTTILETTTEPESKPGVSSEGEEKKEDVFPGGSSGGSSSGSSAGSESITTTIPMATTIPPAPKTIVSVKPSSKIVNKSESFVINIDINTTDDVYAVQFYLSFNSSIIEALSVGEGDFLNKDGASTFSVISINNTMGKITFANTRFGQVGGVTGCGTLANITFNATSVGSTVLDLQDITLSDPNIQEIQSSSVGGRVIVE